MKQSNLPDNLNTDNSLNTDLSLNAEAESTLSLSYWQLVRRRFRGNAYGMGGLIGCCLVILTALFAPFLAPYDAGSKDRDAIFSPPSDGAFHPSRRRADRTLRAGL